MAYIYFIYTNVHAQTIVLTSIEQATAASTDAGEEQDLHETDKYFADESVSDDDGKGMLVHQNDDYPVTITGFTDANETAVLNGPYPTYSGTLIHQSAAARCVGINTDNPDVPSPDL